MKKTSLMLSAFFLLLYGSVVLCEKGYAATKTTEKTAVQLQPQVHRDNGAEAKKENETEPTERQKFIQDIFNLIHREERQPAEFNKDEQDALRKKLIEFGEKNPKDSRGVLFARAESFYRLNEYKRAYVAFYRLFMRIESKNDPLYSIVEKRLRNLEKEVKPKKTKVVPKEGNVYPRSLYALLIFIALALAYHDIHTRKKASLEQGAHNSNILPGNKLITIEVMREQDGRCSRAAIEEYKTLRSTWAISGGTEIWDELLESDQKKLEHARLLVEGHEMIKEVNTLTPYPIFYISKIPWIGTLPYFWRYTLVGSVFALLWFMASKTGMGHMEDFGVFFLLAAFVISCFSGIRIMAEKTINALDEVVSMLEPVHVRETLENLKVWIERLFRSPRQYYFFVVIMILIVHKQFQKDRLLNSYDWFNIDLFFCIVLVLVASTLTWFMTGSIILMNRIYNLEDLSMNPLSPSKTMGLEKMISVIGTYNIVCSIVLSFGCSIAVYQAHVDGQGATHGALWFFMITPMLVFYWIYPYLKIGKLVKAKKRQRMNFVKTKISLLFNDWVKAEDAILQNSERQKTMRKEDPDIALKVQFEKLRVNKKMKEMERYHEIFKKIENSPESYFDLNSAMELAKVMGFPSLFALLSALISFYA